MAGKKLSPLYGIGSVTLLTVLLVLCLTLFAVMALANAQADWRLSEKNASSVQAYYAADAQAAQLTALVEEFALQEQNKFADAATFSTGLLNHLLAQKEEAEQWDLATTIDGDAIFLTATIPVQENQTLEVELSLLHLAQTGWQTPKLERWQVTPDMEGYTGDESLPVYTFDF